MGRTRARVLFEFRDQWISTVRGRDGFFRFWYDNGAGRTKRKKLTSNDLPSAKEELVALLNSTNVSTKNPENVLIADVLAHYLVNHATPRGYKPMAAARRAAQLCILAMQKTHKHPKVADLTRIMQRRIWGALSNDAGLSAKSIKTYMISVRAAIRYSALPQIVEKNGEEHEVRLLEYPIDVFCNETEIAEHIQKPVSQPRHWIPTYEQFGAWLNAIQHEDDFRCAIIALNTWARNEAIFDLVISKQVDYEFGTIDLNPPGRSQTKKKRPIVRLTIGLAAWFEQWGDDKPIRQYQDTVEKRLNKIGKSIGMPKFTLYTIRHFMATQSRRTSKSVSREQRSLWLGHTVASGSKTTDWYETFDPDYLEGPMRATEEIIRKLGEHTVKPLFTRTVHAQSGFRTIERGGQ